MRYLGITLLVLAFLAVVVSNSSGFIELNHSGWYSAGLIFLVLYALAIFAKEEDDG